MTSLLCPVCDAPCEGGHFVGDTTVFICPHCGGFRMSGTLLERLRNGTIEKPDPSQFKLLVKRKRGDSDEYPTIVSDDLRA